MDYLKSLDFSFMNVLDVILVAILLYYVYQLLKGTVAINIFLGIAILYLIWRLTEYLNMRLLYTIFGGFMKVGIIALIVVFQPEIRKFLLMVGSTNIKQRRKNFLSRLKIFKNESTSITNVEAVVKACTKMGSTKTGALIVFERHNNIDYLVTIGDEVELKVSEVILESIFFKNSPLHDGAIIITNNVIRGTRVILPVNMEKTIPNHFGLRHRAAIGITEKTDALALVVSEETGQLSFIKNGDFCDYTDTADLIQKIRNYLEK